ncbi:TolC family protein [Photobacterium sp. DNB23_23_1]|uniref:TolC family protein n=1 Tax=Photobacterium pectinilyticum TaxID=2906793 RepID=A0ABT1MZX5_9GAMM|nr:TolC family protein [Photobacterium sp. ZSDE20]MCQ1058053.1 TolC family protein [Photobacterium sp. ZSDE20]MDD1822586.1 TolC family protein [Photobacterium sp. ZSDE20]
MRLTPALTCWAMMVVPASANANDIIVNDPHNASIPVATASPAQHPVSFLDAWQAVVSQNDGLAAERANIARSQNMQDAAKDLYLPSISATAKYTRLDKPVEIKPSDLIESMPIGDVVSGLPIFDQLFTSQLTNREVFTSSIRAVWPIFTGGRITAAQDIAKGQTEEATQLLAMKQQATFEDLSKFYFGVALAQQVLETRIEVENGLKKHFVRANKLEQQGQIAEVERLQAQASYDKARVERQKAQRDMEIAQVALTKLLKVDTPAVPISSLFVNESLPPMSAFIDKTLAGYPGLQLLDAKKKQAQGLMAAEKGKYYPEVYLYGNYNLYEDDTLAAKTEPDWAVGVGVNIPLLDSSGRSGKVKAAHSAVTQVNYLRAQAEQDLTVLVEKTYREALQSLEEYNGLASSLELAKENVSLREKAFSQGLSTSLGVVDAELYLAGVKTQRAAAAYQYVISLARLLAVSSEINSFKQYQQYQGLEVQS